MATLSGGIRDSKGSLLRLRLCHEGLVVSLSLFIMLFVPPPPSVLSNQALNVHLIIWTNTAIAPPMS